MPSGILSSTESLTLLSTLIVNKAEFHACSSQTPPGSLRKRSEVVASFNRPRKLLSCHPSFLRYLINERSLTKWERRTSLSKTYKFLMISNQHRNKSKT
jgi:hypothetical protein